MCVARLLKLNPHLHRPSVVDYPVPGIAPKVESLVRTPINLAEEVESKTGNLEVPPPTPTPLFAAMTT